MGGFFASPASDPYDGRREHRNIHVGRKSISRAVGLWVCGFVGVWVCVLHLGANEILSFDILTPVAKIAWSSWSLPVDFGNLTAISYQEKSSTIQFVHFEKHGLHCTCTYHDEWMSTVTWCILCDLAIIASRCYTYPSRSPFLVASLCSVPLDLPRQVFQM